jgi:two-component system sensor histidine kinase RpfC
MIDCRVLIIDDDHDTRESLATALTDAGFHVEESPDAAAALRRVDAGEKFDVALLDVHLPGPSVEETLARLKGSGARVVVVTADGSARVLHLARQAKLLRKPMDLDELEQAVKEACAA